MNVQSESLTPFASNVRAGVSPRDLFICLEAACFVARLSEQRRSKFYKLGRERTTHGWDQSVTGLYYRSIHTANA